VKSTAWAKDRILVWLDVPLLSSTAPGGTTRFIYEYLIKKKVLWISWNNKFTGSNFSFLFLSSTVFVHPSLCRLLFNHCMTIIIVSCLIILYGVTKSNLNSKSIRKEYLATLKNYSTFWIIWIQKIIWVLTWNNKWQTYLDCPTTISFIFNTIVTWATITIIAKFTVCKTLTIPE